MTPRETRRLRIRVLRKRVVAGGIAAFAAVWGWLYVELASGHDPAIGVPTADIPSADAKPAAAQPAAAQPTDTQATDYYYAAPAPVTTSQS
jgi:hypothetical protein